MVEKEGLDSKTNLFFDDYKEPKEKKKIRQRIIKFNHNAPKCENFCWKKGEIRVKIYWCKKTNEHCIYAKCPKINHNL